MDGSLFTATPAVYELQFSSSVVSLLFTKYLNRIISGFYGELQHEKPTSFYSSWSLPILTTAELFVDNQSICGKRKNIDILKYMMQPFSGKNVV